MLLLLSRSHTLLNKLVEILYTVGSQEFSLHYNSCLPEIRAFLLPAARFDLRPV